MTEVYAIQHLLLQTQSEIVICLVVMSVPASSTMWITAWGRRSALKPNITTSFSGRFAKVERRNVSAAPCPVLLTGCISVCGDEDNDLGHIPLSWFSYH